MFDLWKVTAQGSPRKKTFFLFFFFAIRSPIFFFFFFFFFFLWLDPRFFPPFSSLFLFFSPPLFCAFLPHSYLGLGGVALSRQCGKMNFLKAKNLWFFLQFGGFYCASYTCWPADIHTTYSLCAHVFKCTKPLDMLRYTSAWWRFKKCLAAIMHEYDIAIERICRVSKLLHVQVHEPQHNLFVL